MCHDQLCIILTNSSFVLLSLQRPDGEVQLNKIKDVVYVDDDPSDPYQFNVIIDGRKPWKLKASSEVWCMLV